MNVVKKSSGTGSGFHMAKKAYDCRWGIPMEIPSSASWILADASTPSPNLRASEVFLQLAVAAQFPERALMSFMGYGGTLGEYQQFWPGTISLEDALWREFYAPSMRNIDKVPGQYAPASLLGDVHQQRAVLLQRLGPYLKIPDVGLVLPLEMSFNLSLASLSWHGETALGKIPCPDCSHQRNALVYHPIRFAQGQYFLCKNEASPKESGCKGAKSWRVRQAWEIPIAELAKLTGVRLSGKAIYQLIWESALAQNSALLVRDYSSSRGTAERIVARYPTPQVAVSTAINIYKGGKDATVYDLARDVIADPAKWAVFLGELPIFSQGEIWDISLD